MPEEQVVFSPSVRTCSRSWSSAVLGTSKWNSCLHSVALFPAVTSLIFHWRNSDNASHTSLAGVIQIPFDEHFQKQEEGLLTALYSILTGFLSDHGVSFTKTNVVWNCLVMHFPVRVCVTSHSFLFRLGNLFDSNCILCDFKNAYELFQVALWDEV